MTRSMTPPDKYTFPSGVSCNVRFYETRAANIYKIIFHARVRTGKGLRTHEVQRTIGTLNKVNTRDGEFWFFFADEGVAARLYTINGDSWRTMPEARGRVLAHLFSMLFMDPLV